MSDANKPRPPAPSRARAPVSSAAPPPDPDDDDATASRDEKLARQQAIIQQWQNRNMKNRRNNYINNNSASNAAANPANPAAADEPAIRFKTLFRNTILDVFKQKGWRESESETEWDIFWTNKEWIRGILDKVHLDPTQRVNHFRNFYELTRKDLLVKNLKRAKRILQKKGLHAEADMYYNFFPDTFALPAEYSLFVEAFKKSPNSVFIMKPIGSSQGKGIFLFEKLSQISEWKNDYKYNNSSNYGGASSGGNGNNSNSGGGGSTGSGQSGNANNNSANTGNNNSANSNNNANNDDGSQAEKYIVQKYINNPLLIGGKKFDLRIYVLCLSYQPLVAYIYREGFARFSSTRYSNDKKTLYDAYVHLTNVAIQKKGDNYDPESGGKWDVRSLKLYLIDQYGVPRVDQLFQDIQAICIRSLLCVQKVMIQDKNSFELYGYDILIDDQLKPWLIEVNASPSLTANTPADYQMKLALLHDTITIVDMEKKLQMDTSAYNGNMATVNTTAIGAGGNTSNMNNNNNNTNSSLSPVSPPSLTSIGGFDLLYKGACTYQLSAPSVYSCYLGTANPREDSLRALWKQIKQYKYVQQLMAQAQTGMINNNNTNNNNNNNSNNNNNNDRDRDREYERR